MKRICLFVMTVIVAFSSFSQNNVGIGLTNPNPQAALDIYSSTKGLLIPRMSSTQRISIAPVPNGLLVFDIDSGCVLVFDSNATVWKNLCDVNLSAAGGDLRGSYPNPIVTGLQGVPVSGIPPSTDYILQYNGTQWVSVNADSLNTANIYNSNGTLTGTRTVTMAADSLTFNSTTGTFAFNTTGGNMSFGNGNVVTGIYGMASGLGDTASGRSTVAMGEYTMAVGPYSTAIGQYTTALGPGSLAMGIGSVAHGSASTAMGVQTFANSTTSVAMGFQTQAMGTYGLATGQFTYALGDYSTTFGYLDTATGPFSVVMGRFNNAVGLNSMAFGNGNEVNGNGDFAIGLNNVSNGPQGSLVLGYQGTANGTWSTAMGDSAIASGDISMAMGYSTTAASYDEMAIGQFNTPYTPASATAWVATDRLFGIGNGASASSLSDALVVLKNGNVGIGTSAPSAQLTTTGTVQFQQIPAQAQGSDTKFLTVDAAGNVHWNTAGSATGCGTTNYLMKSNGTGSTCSIVYDNGTQVSVNNTSGFGELDVLQSGGQHVLLGGGSNTGSEIKFLSFGTAHFSIYNNGGSDMVFAQTSALAQTNTAGNTLMTIGSSGYVTAFDFQATANGNFLDVMNDLDSIDHIRPLRRLNPVTNKTELVNDVSSYPSMVAIRGKDGNYNTDLGNLASLNTGAIRQLRAETKTHDQMLDERVARLENLVSQMSGKPIGTIEFTATSIAYRGVESYYIVDARIKPSSVISISGLSDYTIVSQEEGGFGIKFSSPLAQDIRFSYSSKY